MRVGDLVRITTSTHQKCVGKLAIILETYPHNVLLHIIQFQKTEIYGIKKLEVLCK